MSDKPSEIFGVKTNIVNANGTNLSQPAKPEEILGRPEVVAVEVKMKMPRKLAERTFQRARFVESDFVDGYATITEKLRPVKKGEHATHLHIPTGVQFCVDHYEMDGVIL